jgi:chromate transport protein ChrA
MLNGLAPAETTPGPLILVLQYVGFFAGWDAGEGSPIQLAVAVAAAALTTHVASLPSFLLIFLGAPHVDRLQRVAAPGSALAAITAAVVGVILNLAVFLATAALLVDGQRLDGFAAAVAAVTFAVLLRFDLPLHWVVVAGGADRIGPAGIRLTRPRRLVPGRRLLRRFGALRHRLQGVHPAFQFLVAFGCPGDLVAERTHHRQRRVGVLGDQTKEHLGIDLQDLQRLGGANGRRPRLIEDDRHLAEQIVAAEHTDLDLAALLLGQHLDLALVNDVGAVGRVALVEKVLALLEG